MRQFSLFDVPSWEKRRSEMFEIVLLALQELRSNIPSDPSEPALNRSFYLCLESVVIQQEFDFLPTPEGKSPPDQSDQVRTLREDKICDFYWSCVDHVAKKTRYLYIECKRLGTPSSPTWHLNKNYIKNGIRRFVTSPHEYGKNEDVCGMVGYVQNMTFDDILDEVNQAADVAMEAITPLVLDKNGWQEKGVSKLTHQLTRPFPKSPFEMVHYWVDLRD